MADDKEKTIVLGIELDLDQLIEASVGLQEEIDKIKLKQKELSDSGQKNSVEFQKNAAALRLLQVEYRDTNKLVDAGNKLKKEEKGSLEAMKLQLQISTKEYNLLSKAKRDDVEIGGKMQKEIDALSNSIKINEQAIGDNRRSVGDYSQGLHALPGPLGEASEGVAGLKKQFLALLANPIILVIAGIALALKGLHSAFTSTDSGALEFEVRMGQVKSTLSVAKERAFDFGNAIIDLFKGDKEGAAKKLASAFGITGQSFADAAEQARIYAEALDDIEDAEAAYVAKSAENKNKIAKLEFESADRSNSKEARIKALDEAIKIEREETNVKKEEAQKRLNIEATNLAHKIGLNNTDLKSFVALTEEQRKHTDKAMQEKYDKYHEEFAALTDFYAKAVDADTAYYENTKKLSGKATALQEQLDAEAKQKHDEAIKKAEEAEQKAFERNQLRLKDEKAMLQVQVMESIKNSEGELNNKIALAEKERDIELSQKKLTANMKLLIEHQYQQNVLKLHEEYTKQQEELTKKAIADQLKLEEDRYTRAKLMLAQDSISKKQALDELHQQGLISEKEYVDGLRQIDIEASQKAKQLQIDDLNEKIKLEKEGSTKKLEYETQVSQLVRDIKVSEENLKRDEAKKTAALEKQLLNARLSAAQNFFGGLAGLTEEGSAAYKGFASLQVVASTAQGAMGAFAQASAIFPPPFGQIAGLAAAGVVVAQGALQLQKINELERGGLIFPKAERGMIIGGRPHSQGGTKFYGDDGTLFEAEKDELLAIVNKRSTGMIRNLSAWNQLGGGVSFGAGSRSFLADGGFAARAMSQSVSDIVNQQISITDAIAAMPQQVVIVEHMANAIGKMVEVKGRAQI